MLVMGLSPSLWLNSIQTQPQPPQQNAVAVGAPGFVSETGESNAASLPPDPEAQP